MKNTKRVMLLLGVVTVMLFLVAACGGTAEPQVIRETVVVEKEVVKIETVEIEKEVVVEKEVVKEVEKEVEEFQIIQTEEGAHIKLICNGEPNIQEIKEREALLKDELEENGRFVAKKIFKLSNFITIIK